MLRVGTTDIIEHRVSSAWQQIGGAGGGGSSGIPDGGTTAQALVKESATDGDAGWGDADAIAGFEAAVDARVAAAVLTVTTTTDTVTQIERKNVDRRPCVCHGVGLHCERSRPAAGGLHARTNELRSCDRYDNGGVCG